MTGNQKDTIIMAVKFAFESYKWLSIFKLCKRFSEPVCLKKGKKTPRVKYTSHVQHLVLPSSVERGLVVRFLCVFVGWWNSPHSEDPQS